MSPIETRLLTALRASVPDGWCVYDLTQGNEDGIPGIAIGEGKNLANLQANAPIGTYRCDFYIMTVERAQLAIECDGHEFHDRTKQQAAYDRARDRELLLLGVTTIRFTGSEIFHSPERCAAEAYAVLSKLNAERERLYDVGRSVGIEQVADILRKGRAQRMDNLLAGVV